LASSNVILAFIFHGGPVDINVLGGVSDMCIIVAPFVDTFTPTMLLESLVALVATTITFHSGYFMVIAIGEIYERRLRKTDHFLYT